MLVCLCDALGQTWQTIQDELHLTVPWIGSCDGQRATAALEMGWMEGWLSASPHLAFVGLKSTAMVFCPQDADVSSGGLTETKLDNTDYICTPTL